MELLGHDRGRAPGVDRDVSSRAIARGQARRRTGRRQRAPARCAAQGARRRARRLALSARRKLYRRRSQRRQHPVLGAAGTDRFHRVSAVGRLAAALRRAARGARGARITAVNGETMRQARLTRRRLLGVGTAGAALLASAPAPIISVGREGGRAMAQSNPETVVYVSNAGGPETPPEIHVLAMNRAKGDLTPIERVAIPGADKASPSSMPLALSPDRRFLHAALRSEPFTAASFAIDPASGRLSHLGNAPLDASMAYT